MNTVALPASAPAPTLSAEADLVRQAARGDAESFDELFRRHGQVAWRVAQAVSVSRESAVAAVSQGFNRSLRAGRRRPAGDTIFRTTLLAGVYKTAIEDARQHAAGGAAASAAVGAPPAAPAATPARRGRSKRKADEAADAAVMESAFRSLPERWRAAVWLTEVEAMDTDRVASVLGVSAAVAAQLLNRGRRGLSGRFAQANRPEPAHLGTALRPVAMAMPVNLAEVVAVRWQSALHDPATRLAPMNEWLGEKTARPLQVAIGGLLGLGLIGLGLVGEGASVLTSPAAVPSVPQNGSGTGVSQSGYGGGFGLGPTQLASGFPGANGANGGLLAAAAAAAGAGSGPFGTASGAGGFSWAFGGGGGGAGSTPGGGGGTVPLSIGPGVTVPPGVTNPGGSSPAPVPGVVSVSSGGGGTTASVLPTSSGPTASATVGCKTGVGITVGTTQIGCKKPASTSTTSTTTPVATTLPKVPVSTTLPRVPVSTTLPHGL